LEGATERDDADKPDLPKASRRYIPSMPFYAQVFPQTNFARGFVWESVDMDEFFEVPVLIKAGRIGNYGQ
jgi:hypothetical protein